MSIAVDDVQDAVAAAAASSATSPTSTSSWIHLRTGKEFSRLLYPNPVCFLCTTTTTTSSSSVVTEESNKDNEASQQGNVMVISWLTATNNSGNFIMSINRHRYSATLLLQKRKEFFTLCVPIAGMEELVLDVGSISGRTIPSKFDRRVAGDDSCTRRSAPIATTTSSISKRQRKKLKRERFAHEGIPGLVKVPFGNVDTISTSTTAATSTKHKDSLFGIQGTVAHMKCKVISTIEDNDEDHYLVRGKVVDAYCHAEYWDEQKLLFCPKKPGIMSFLSFFGSQEFGQVVPTKAAEEEKGKGS